MGRDSAGDSQDVDVIRIDLGSGYVSERILGIGTRLVKDGMALTDWVMTVQEGFQQLVPFLNEVVKCPGCENIFPRPDEEATVGNLNGLPHVRCPKCKKCIGCMNVVGIDRG